QQRAGYQQRKDIPRRVNPPAQQPRVQGLDGGLTALPGGENGSRDERTENAKPDERHVPVDVAGKQAALSEHTRKLKPPGDGERQDEKCRSTALSKHHGRAWTTQLDRSSGQYASGSENPRSSRRGRWRAASTSARCRSATGWSLGCGTAPGNGRWLCRRRKIRWSWCQIGRASC